MTQYCDGKNCSKFFQELIRFNRLVAVVKRTLLDMIKAVKGLVVMSGELEGTLTALVVGKVPDAWASKSYPSLKPLGSYVTDLLARYLFVLISKFSDGNIDMATTQCKQNILRKRRSIFYINVIFIGSPSRF